MAPRVVVAAGLPPRHHPAPPMDSRRRWRGRRADHLPLYQPRARDKVHAHRPGKWTPMEPATVADCTDRQARARHAPHLPQRTTAHAAPGRPPCISHGAGSRSSGRGVATRSIHSSTHSSVWCSSCSMHCARSLERALVRVKSNAWRRRAIPLRPSVQAHCMQI